ncbi:MFS transporter [Saccharomonospora piscinae]|uniref:MFS transporter n=1 Tax=Saccharomonospora piscinae TaxID=687388 RepID=UPI0004672854|nr:MFS transporter [Saccharomonospora piscinae]
MRDHTTADRLPVGALLALTTAAFLTVLTEALPAGVLPGLSRDLGVSQATAGQTVTVYAIGTALSAIPLTAATARWRRKHVLLTGVAGFAAANTVTAVGTGVELVMGARFVAGIAAGLVWALLAGYARRLAPAGREGRAIAVVMAGIPLALSLGVPAGTFLGTAVGWRWTFALVTGLALALLVWVVAVVPDRPGAEARERLPLARALARPGVVPVLVVTALFVLAHTIGYTYIAALLGSVGLASRVDVMLLVFGIASMVSIWLVGIHIDRRLRLLSLCSVLLVGAASAALAGLTGGAVFVAVAIAVWGLGWGGAPTLLQTAVARAGGEVADTAQAVLVTIWNAAMAAGGAVGGIAIGLTSAAVLPLWVLALLIPVLVVVLRGSGFPRIPGQQSEGATSRRSLTIPSERANS